MHVLHVINSTAGGVGMSTFEAVRGLAERGTQSSIVCNARGMVAAPEGLRDAVDGRLFTANIYFANRRTRHSWPQRVGSWVHQTTTTIAGLRGPRQIATIAKRVGCDVIHTQTIVTPDGAIAAATLGLPHVWHLRELVGPGEPADMRRLHRVAQAAHRGETAVIAVSDASYARFVATAGSAPHTIIQNAVDTDQLSRLCRRPHGGRRLIVAMIANLSATWKRHDLFIEACALVKSDAEFRIYGALPHAQSNPSSYVDELRALAAAKGLSKLEFAGHCGISAMYSNIDVLVHTSGRESFGRVYAEAMAAGIPVIAVTGGAADEVIDDGTTGLLTQPNKVDIASRVDELLSSPSTRAKLAFHGKRHALEAFNRDVHATALDAVYAETMSHHTSKAKRLLSAWMSFHI